MGIMAAWWGTTYLLSFSLLKTLFQESWHKISHFGGEIKILSNHFYSVGNLQLGNDNEMA